MVQTGRSLPEVMMTLVPEAWEKHQSMSAEKKAFYEYASCFMEPWDGPASIPFTDGRCIGAILHELAVLHGGARPHHQVEDSDEEGHGENARHQDAATLVGDDISVLRCHDARGPVLRTQSSQLARLMQG